MAFPNTIVPRAALHEPINNFATALTANINATQTTIPIATKQIGVIQLPAAGMVSIGKEIIYYQAINPIGPQLINCIRGFDNTIASPHATGERVEVRWVAAHHNALADLLYTIQVVLGANILDGAQQLGPSQVFASMAEKMALTLPQVVPISPASAAWTVQHARRRPVGVQLYEWDAVNAVFHSFEAPIRQSVDPTGPGPSTVIVEPFASAKEGVVILL